jgi:glycopeptide antibiotics resistance protein
VLSGEIVLIGAIPALLLVAARVRPWPRALVALVAVAHIAFVVAVALFPLPVERELIAPARAAGWGGAAAYAVDLVPLETIRRSIRLGFGSYQFIQAAQNVLVLAPFGLYAPVLWPRLRATGRFLPVAVLAGCSIEVAQLVVSLILGFPYRSIDVDDAILNTIGILLAYLAYRTIAILFGQPATLVRRAARNVPDG